MVLTNITDAVEFTMPQSKVFLESFNRELEELEQLTPALTFVNMVDHKQVVLSHMPAIDVCIALLQSHQTKLYSQMCAEQVLNPDALMHF